MIDCHVHSSFSGDSEMPAESACRKAIEAGLGGITFTDHLDYDFPDFDEGFNIDFDEYVRFMSSLKKDYLPDFKVLMGIEVGIQPHVLEDTLKVVQSYNFDFVIASAHIIDGMDPYRRVYYNGKSKYEAYSKYLEQVHFTVTNFADFDVVGHIDYIIRCADYGDNSLFYKDHADLIDAIFRELASKGRGMEINTSSYREKPGISTPCYDFRLLTRYRELGGEIITFGSDSHSEEYIGYKFGYFKEMLLKAGFKYLAHFENRKPVFEAI